MRFLLQQRISGGVFHQAGYSDEALALVNRQPFDLVILDVEMPGSFCLEELLRAMRQSRPTMPILVFSGQSEPAFVARALRFGATGFLPKGVPAEELLNIVLGMLDGSERLLAVSVAGISGGDEHRAELATC